MPAIPAGWAGPAIPPAPPSRAAEPLARIGQGDRSFLKLLASRPSERSFEDGQWNGGHGVFTHSLLEGLNGQADADGDGVIRASEAIDYVSRRVPELTGMQQHPRVAGTFDARLALASSEMRAAAPRAFPLDVSGPAGSSVYIDNVFRGAIRAGGSLRVDALAPGPHGFSADFPNGSSLNGAVTLPEAPARVAIAPPAPSPLAQLRARINAGRVMEPNGAWEFYRSQTFAGPERAAAEALMAGSLEEYGQACVSDYVQSTATGLKRAMLQRAVDAFDRLQTMRPSDPSIETRKLFCRGRLLIADSRFAEVGGGARAIVEARSAVRLRVQCARRGARAASTGSKESRQAFETAAKLTPEWGLPPFQIAQQLVTSGTPARRCRIWKRRSATIRGRWSIDGIWRTCCAWRGMPAGRSTKQPSWSAWIRTIRRAISNWGRRGNCSANPPRRPKHMTVMCCWLRTMPARKRCAPARPACAGKSRPAPTLRK